MHVGSGDTNIERTSCIAGKGTCEKKHNEGWVKVLSTKSWDFFKAMCYLFSCVSCICFSMAILIHILLLLLQSSDIEISKGSLEEHHPNEIYMLDKQRYGNFCYWNYEC